MSTNQKPRTVIVLDDLEDNKEPLRSESLSDSRSDSPTKTQIPVCAKIQDMRKAHCRVTKRRKIFTLTSSTKAAEVEVEDTKAHLSPLEPQQQAQQKQNEQEVRLFFVQQRQASQTLASSSSSSCKSSFPACYTTEEFNYFLSGKNTFLVKETIKNANGKWLPRVKLWQMPTRAKANFLANFEVDVQDFKALASGSVSVASAFTSHDAAVSQLETSPKLTSPKLNPQGFQRFPTELSYQNSLLDFVNQCNAEVFGKNASIQKNKLINKLYREEEKKNKKRTKPTKTTSKAQKASSSKSLDASKALEISQERNKLETQSERAFAFAFTASVDLPPIDQFFDHARAPDPPFVAKGIIKRRKRKIFKL